VSAASCLFCRIVDGQIPAEVVLTDPGAVAFLDVQPLADGHVLVVSRAHVARVEELTVSDAAALFRTVARLVGPVRRAVDAEGATIGINDGEVSGQTIPHVHVHIVPRGRGDGAGNVHSIFRSGPRRPVADIAAAVRQEIERS
jgi:histidine triad (HIT) family protein